MRAFTSDQFVLPLPEAHRFPMEKYRLLRERVQAELRSVRLQVAPAVQDVSLLRVHDSTYVDAVVHGTLDKRAVRAIGFPWSEALVQRSRRSVGATVAGMYAAMDDGVAANLAGGTHHAGVARGQGFCVFNDVAVAAREAQAVLGVGRVAIVDLDVHQGNGTAEIFASDPSVFTLSAHGERNFPFHKARSDRDVPLPDGTDDAGFFEQVLPALDHVRDKVRPEAVFYVAGVDPYQGDRLGRLSLSAKGLQQRDLEVLERFAGDGVPTVVCMAGGYAPDPSEIAGLHLQTIRTAAQFFKDTRSLAPPPRRADVGTK